MQSVHVDQAFEQVEKLKIFQFRGRDKRGRKILRVIGKFFLGGVVSIDVVKKYLEEKILPELEKQLFVVVYLHTDIEKSDNFIGISALRSFYDAIPVKVRDNLESVYFIHPGVQERLFLATFGRFIFSGGLYGKMKYISRIDYLWEHVRRNEIEIPEFVYDHDEDLEYRPMMNYGMECDHARIYDGVPAVDSSSVQMYSTRCIS